MWESFKLFVQSANLILFILLTVLVLTFYSKLFQLNKKVNRLKRRYDTLLRGQGELNMEELIRHHGADIAKHGKMMEELVQRQKLHHAKVESSIQKVGFYRYNAFPELQNQLSYSFALLDMNNNGILVSSIYGRESSTTYGKKIVEGRCDRELSPEEEKCLEEAMKA